METNPLGVKSTQDGKPRLEMDESKINTCQWIFISIEKIYPFGYKNSQRMDINIQILDK